MNREKAIKIICEVELEKLSKEKREELLLCWWGIDDEDPEFGSLPKALQQEILESDAPIKDVTDSKYDPLLIEALKTEFIGVKNEYIENELSKILLKNIEVQGKEEILLPCNCCLYQTIKERGNYEICPVCFWEDDGNSNSDIYSSANHMTLAEGKNNFKTYGCVSKNLIKKIKEEAKNRYLRNRA